MNLLSRMGIGIIGLLLVASPAFAYRSATIATDQAQMKDSPSPDANTIETLPQGTRVNTSDQPTNGYYHARSVSNLGWIQESDLGFGNGQTPSAPSASTQPEVMQQQQPSTPSGNSGSWAVKIFGGLDFWKSSDLDALIQSNSLDTGEGFGGEIDMPLSKNWGLGLRFEKLSKTSTGPFTNNGQTDTLDFELSSMPVMVGLDYQVAPGDNFSMDFGGYVGAGFSTSLTQTDTSLSSNNVTQLNGTAAALVLSADLNWHITRPVWLFVEPGYRYLKTGALSPSPLGSGNAGKLFEDTNGNPVSVDLDLSGLFVNFGARIGF